jgi:hypothetical protein
MSSPRYDWWGYVKGIIRRYPLLRDEYKDLHDMAAPNTLSLVRHGSSVSRTTENRALLELPKTKQREYAAVRAAIAQTERYRDGRDRLTVIRLIYWDRTRTLSGAARDIPVSYETARIWHGEFIRLVASFYGLMDN